MPDDVTRRPMIVVLSLALALLQSRSSRNFGSLLLSGIFKAMVRR